MGNLLFYDFSKNKDEREVGAKVKHTYEEYKEAILNAASARSKERFLTQAEQEGFDAWAMDKLEKIAYPEAGD